MASRKKSQKVCGNGEFRHTPKKYSKKTEKKRFKKGKNQKKHLPKKSRAPKKKFCNTCTLFSILSGDFSFVRIIFFRLYGRGYFQYMYSQLDKDEIQRWVEDVSHEVFLSLYKKYLNGTIFKIEHKKAYIRQIVFYKSYDENRRIAKFVSLDLLEFEKDSQT